MKAILEYIVLNYTWFLGGAIIILLAIIGSYADKTNFGQGKTKEDEKLKELELEKLELQQQLEEAQKIQEETVEIDNQVEEIKEEPAPQTFETQEVSESIKKEEMPTLENYEEKYAKFDKVFDELLPEKGFDDGDLLDEIENISLDKTQKIDLADIPDLDDVELPKIKNLDPVDEDIWKF